MGQGRKAAPLQRVGNSYGLPVVPRCLRKGNKVSLAVDKAVLGVRRVSAKTWPGVYREVQLANHHLECLAYAHDSHVQ